MMRFAQPSDRIALGAMLDRAFAKEGDENRFLNCFPHLFTDAAIGQHMLVVEGGTILACVGCYRFQAHMHRQPLRVAGIGQVATSPEARGRGLMTGLLNAVLEAAHDIDLFWLYGDRQRYGRVGFALGGLVHEGFIWDRYVSAPSSSAIRALDLERDAPLIAAALTSLPFSLEQTGAERLTMLRGKLAGGWTDGSACILLDDKCRTIWASHGSPSAIVELVAHQVKIHGLRDPKDTGVTFHSDPCDLPAMAALHSLACAVKARPTCMLRVGRLRPLLAAWAAAHPPVRGARLPDTVLDGGPAGCVRIAVEDGGWRITDDDGPADHTLADPELAEVVFDLIPPPVAKIPLQSALGHLLPLHFSIPECYGL